MRIIKSTLKCNNVVENSKSLPLKRQSSYWSRLRKSLTKSQILFSKMRSSPCQLASRKSRYMSFKRQPLQQTSEMWTRYSSMKLLCLLTESTSLWTAFKWLFSDKAVKRLSAACSELWQTKPRSRVMQWRRILVAATLTIFSSNTSSQNSKIKNVNSALKSSRLSFNWEKSARKRSMSSH